MIKQNKYDKIIITGSDYMQNPFQYTDNNKRYHTLDYFYKNKNQNYLNKLVAAKLHSISSIVCFRTIRVF